MENHPLNFNVTLKPCSKKPKLVYSWQSPSGVRQRDFYDGDKHEIIEGSKISLGTKIKRMDNEHIKLSVSSARNWHCIVSVSVA